MVSNAILRDANISFKAKWLFAYMFSMKEWWDFAISRMAKDSADWEKSVTKWIDELKAAGYLTTEKLSNWRMVYNLTFEPSNPAPVSKLPKVQTGGLAVIKNTINKDIVKKKKNTNVYHPYSHKIIELFSNEVKKRWLIYESTAEFSTATKIAEDEIIKSFVIDNKFSTLTEFMLWIMNNADNDNWHKPRMNSLKYFLSNWAKIANLNKDKLNSSSVKGNDERLERAKLLLNKSK